jgi:hypothetical protein
MISPGSREPIIPGERGVVMKGYKQKGEITADKSYYENKESGNDNPCL